MPLKAALVVGFGLTVGSWLFAGAYVERRIASLDARAEELNDRYIQGQTLLRDARTLVLLASVHIRDAMLTSDPGEAQQALQQMTAELEEAVDNLSQYVPIFDSPGEQARIDRLRNEVTELRAAVADAVGIDSGQWRLTARPFLQKHVAPRREAFMTVASELATINRANFVHGREGMLEVYRTMHRQVQYALGLALAVSLGVAVLSTVYAGRLERQVRTQHAAALDMQHGLQRLSAELIRVREHERRALARELHDEIGQLLTAAKFELAVAQHAIVERGGSADALDDARPIVERALQAVRDLSHMLHPAVLDDLGLSAALDLYVKEFRRRHATMVVELSETGMEQRLPRAIETAAYRIVQEALTNVAKHAGATTCRVSLVRLSHGLVVVVGDDGRGFESGAADRPVAAMGLGLLSMRERAAQLGGSMVVETSPGRGTRIVAELPVSDERGRYEQDQDRAG